MTSIQDKVYGRIEHSGRGWAFSKKDFADMANDGAIRLALVRLLEDGCIRRVMRGVYDYPHYSELLKETLGPDLNQVAHALARKFGWRIQASGNTALNLLGLSTQVPAQVVFLSDGPGKSYDVGGRVIQFKKGPLKESGFNCPESGLLVQAIRALGRERMTSEINQQLRQSIPSDRWPKIVLDTRSVTSWIHETIRKLSESTAV